MAVTKETTKSTVKPKTTKSRKNLDKIVGENPTTATGYQAYYRQCLKAGKVLEY